MKIAIIHCYPIHYKHLLFEAMKKEGLDIEVLFLASQSHIRHEKIPLSQETYCYRIGYDDPYEDAPNLGKASWTWSSLQDTRPDLILISGYHATECWSAWLWGLIHRVPTVMWYESNEFDYPRYWPKELPKRVFMQGLAGAHVYGTSNKAYLVKLGLNNQDVIVKGAVVDVDKFDSAPCQKRYRLHGQTRLIYVGRLADVKNLFTLVRSFAAAANSPATSLRLTIAGTGPLEPSLRNEVAALGIEHLVEFKGYVYQTDLPALYREADFFVLPSTYEPWGNVAIEAMLCRLPILISSQCGCAADVVTSETGWSFSPWDQARLTSLLSDLPSLPVEKIEAMGSAAHDLASTYSPGNCARLIAQSIQHLRDRSSRLRPVSAGTVPAKS